MIRPVRQWPDQILLTPCNTWNHAQPPIDSLQLNQDLLDTLNATNAIGLAANQIGICYRVLIIRSAEYSEHITMYNPIVIEASTTQWIHAEGCLSFPDIELTISRPMTITVNWQDETGNLHTRSFKEIDAKCILHEIDHLDGLVFKQYVSNLKFLQAQKKAKKFKKS